MVTPLESGALLEHFSVIFTWLLVVIVIFAIMQWTKMFGSSKGLHTIIGVIIAFFVIMIPDIKDLISVMIPWFVLLFIFLILIIMAYKIFGATDADVLSALKTDRTVIWVVIIVAIVIAIASFSSVYGQRLLSSSGDVGGTGTGEPGSTATGSFSENIGATFFHPKVIGLIFIFLVAVFTIAILGVSSKVD